MWERQSSFDVAYCLLGVPVEAPSHLPQELLEGAGLSLDHRWALAVGGISLVG